MMVMMMPDTKGDIELPNLTAAVVRELEMQCGAGTARDGDGLHNFLDETERVVHGIDTARERQPLEVGDWWTRGGLATSTNVATQQRIDSIVRVAGVRTTTATCRMSEVWHLISSRTGYKRLHRPRTTESVPGTNGEGKRWEGTTDASGSPSNTMIENEGVPS